MIQTTAQEIHKLIRKKFAEAKRTIGNASCTYRKGDVCFEDPTNIHPCDFSFCTNCRWLREHGITDRKDRND